MSEQPTPESDRTADRGSSLAGARTKPVQPILDQSGKDIALCLLVALAETGLVLVGISTTISLPTMLLIHCGIMLGVTLVLDQRERSRMDSRILAVAVVTTAVSGPIGATLSALLGIYLRYRKLETELLDKWYERISGHTVKDDVLELHERIQAGRTLNPFVDARARFAAILRSGPLDEKQRVLSIITQKYHREFAGLLQLALRNQDPPIRVQAAAVVARLKENERLKVRSLMEEAAGIADDLNEQRMDLVDKIMASVATGLLEEQDSAGGSEAAIAICQGILVHDPEQIRALLRLADLRVIEKNDQEAARLLRSLVERGVSEAVAPLRDCLIRMRRFAEAARLAEKSAAAPETGKPSVLGDAA